MKFPSVLTVRVGGFQQLAYRRLQIPTPSGFVQILCTVASLGHNVFFARGFLTNDTHSNTVRALSWAIRVRPHPVIKLPGLAGLAVLSANRKLRGNSTIWTARAGRSPRRSSFPHRHRYGNGFRISLFQRSSCITPILRLDSQDQNCWRSLKASGSRAHLNGC